MTTFIATKSQLSDNHTYYITKHLYSRDFTTHMSGT